MFGCGRTTGDDWTRCLHYIVLCLAAFCVGEKTFADEVISVQQDAQAIRFFENEVRPLLAEACFDCHSVRSEKLKGGLRLDSRTEMLVGGDSGPAIVPGKPHESQLIEAVRYEGLEMPPDRRLSDEQVAKLEKWIALGAPFPGGEDETTSERREAFTITDEDREYWAYRPIRKPDLPNVSDARWNEHPIDKLIYHQLEQSGLKPNEKATPRQLLRRLYFDLIGLPPTPEQIEAFSANSNRDNFAATVDHLLSLPQYGERWGRHWLDVVRFAQSNGYERDGEKPLVWRYRDYVIQSFNEDKPYDRFVREQLAGDELPDATADSVVATGFYRLGVWDDEPDDKRAAEYDGLDDMLSTIGQVFLGQTVGCARCHDHMFDPIAQQDYYELLSFVRNVKFYENPEYNLHSATYAPLAAPGAVASYAAGVADQISELEKSRDTADSDQQKKIDDAINKLRNDKGPFSDWTLAIREHSVTPKETFLLVRGDAGTPGKQVEPRFLSVLGNEASPTPSSAYDMSCGLRTQLANWIASPSNPLTARVIANRVWQYHFGRGIVRTPNDFGKAGLPPTHPQLLDWLAAELIENDWSIKRLHKTILTSRTWQMASTSGDGPEQEADPDNHLFWRQNMRRLDAEAIRDSMLFVAGQLNPKAGGRGFFPQLSSEVLAGQSRPGWGWGISSEAERNRRSVYIFTKRGVRDPLIESFDYVNTTSPLGVRPTTTVAPQALVLLNSRFVQRQALALAKRISKDIGSLPRTRINKLFRLTLGRNARDEELEFATDYVAAQQAGFESTKDIITFKPDVPDALKSDYRKLLDYEEYVLGPRESWSYHPGKWVGGYEGIDALDDERVPFMVWTGSKVGDGQLSGKLMLHNATRFGSLLISGGAAGELFEGTEIRFDPGGQRVVVLQHAEDKLEEVTSLPLEMATSRWIDFKLVVKGSSLRLSLGTNQSSPLLDITLPKPKATTHFGVAVSRGAMSLDDFIIETDEERFEVSNHGLTPTSPELKAIQALCVVLMNTNEFLYID